jgi:hypothetical protein
MAEQREVYKGREIIVRSGEEALAARRGAPPLPEEGVQDVEAPDLYIDGERIFTVRNAAGAFIASGFAFDPQPSPIDLARKIIDYKEAGR